MIKKIDHIRGFGIYKNFVWSSGGTLKDFTSKNIFYGWNYSGKTTLSRLFSSLKNKAIHEDFAEGSSFKISSDGGNYQQDTINTYGRNVEVFNSDYVKENLKWEFDDDINAISFEVGESIDIREKIDNNLAEIAAIQGTEDVIGKKAGHEEMVNQYNQFESLYTNEAKRIKNDVFISLIEFNKGHLKRIKDQIITDINAAIISDKEELKRLQNVVKIESPKEELDLIAFENTLKDTYDLSKNLLSETPSKTQIIEVLEKNHAHYTWAKQGLEIHEKGDECKFCGNPVTEERLTELTKYFNNQASILREKTQKAKQIIYQEIEKLNAINFPLSANDFNNGFQSKYDNLLGAAKKEIDKSIAMLNLLLKDLSKKEENSIYLPISTLAINESGSLQTSIDNLNTLIDENNEFSKSFDSMINVERLKYQKHLVAEFLKAKKYLTAKSNKEKAEKEIEILNAHILKLQNENVKLNAEINSISKGCDQLNTFIQSFLNRNDIKIEVNPETSKFNLKRGSKLAKNLSDGEKTAIAFSHFLVLIYSLEEKGQLKDTIVYIDDPISSLDSNHVFQINALLKDTFCRYVPSANNPSQSEWTIACKQLFISTHNYEFFGLLKELPPTGKNKESRYFISRRNDESFISTLPLSFDKYSSEYHYLFGEIYQFINEPDRTASHRLLAMPNIFRRFLELYTLSKYPSYEEVDKRADKIFGPLVSKRILKVLHYFSHLNSIERISKQSDFISDIEIATTELIDYIKTSDTLHYDALKASV
ncbi:MULTISPECIES: AAA family ATPase [unclassified Sphingobacterium]|uniref:AAA family ATPase n=1 Tax=unclassified Sphingobacterium TaxID=2609468 RepID=UPI0025F0CF13|nr:MULTISPECIES: AAA family ATPase [unclassified Sphingobacterium]